VTPISISEAEKNLDKPLVGVTSPYPTVVKVTTLK